MTRSELQFDRNADEGRVRVYYGHPSNRPCDCARCLQTIPRKQGTAIGWWNDGTAKEIRRYICVGCTEAMKIREEKAA